MHIRHFPSTLRAARLRTACLPWLATLVLATAGAVQAHIVGPQPQVAPPAKATTSTLFQNVRVFNGTSATL